MTVLGPVPGAERARLSSRFEPCLSKGEATIALRDYEGVYAMEAPSLEQYAALGMEVEGKNMKYPHPPEVHP